MVWKENFAFPMFYWNLLAGVNWDVPEDAQELLLRVSWDQAVLGMKSSPQCRVYSPDLWVIYPGINIIFWILNHITQGLLLAQGIMSFQGSQLGLLHWVCELSRPSSLLKSSARPCLWRGIWTPINPWQLGATRSTSSSTQALWVTTNQTQDLTHEKHELYHQNYLHPMNSYHGS